uniref:Uncharacterized protein n=2 Tax=Parascaris univalens TaxID=6257 RepID=A0A915AK72_PARUN
MFHFAVPRHLKMRSEDDANVKPVYADLSRQHVTPHARTLQNDNSDAIRNESWIPHIERPNMTTSPVNPSWAEWELDHSEGNNETRASDGDFVSAIDAIEAFMNTSDSSSENANIHDTSIKISTSTPNFSECSGSSKESVAIVPATSQKKSSRKQARKTKVGNGICPPPPETPSNENWTDPDDIAEFFPKTAQYKTPAGIRFSSQYLVPSKWEREKENYVTKIDYWTGVLQSGRVTLWKDMERIQQLLRQLRWLLTNIWDGDMASTVPPEMLWRARKEEMRRLEQFLSRKRSLIESMTACRDVPVDSNSELQALRGGRSADQAQSSSTNRSKVDSGNNATLGERNVALFLLLFDRRRWSEVAKKMRRGTVLSDAIERYSRDVDSFCRKVEIHPEPSDFQRSRALLERGQALRERLKASGLGHLYKGWSGKPEAQQIGAASSSSTVAESDPAAERRLDLKDIDTIEDKWLSFSRLLSNSKATEIAPLVKQLQQNCASYRNLLKTISPKSLASARYNAKSRRIQACVAGLEEFASRVDPKDRLKNEQGPQTTKSELEQGTGLEEVTESSQRKRQKKRLLPVETDDVVIINERPKRTKKPPARFRLVDEFVSEGLPGSKRNRSPVSAEKAPPKYTIQMKATLDEEPVVKKARGISSPSIKSNNTTEDVAVFSDKIIAVSDFGRDVCDDIKVVSNELIIEIKQVRERRREKGSVRRVLSYIAYFENNIRQRVTRRVYKKWLERKEKDKHDMPDPGASTDKPSVVETMVERIKVESTTDILHDGMENIQESEVRNYHDRCFELDGEVREGNVSAAESTVGQEQNNVSGETADARQTVKKNVKKKLPDVMSQYEGEGAEGRISRCTISPIVSVEEQSTALVLNKTQEVASSGDAEMDVGGADKGGLSSFAHRASSVSEVHSRSESLADSNSHDVKLNNQHDYLLMRSESAFVDSLSEKWVNVPLNGNYNAHVEHIKKLIVALEICLNDPTATWNDYFGQKEIVQATIESLLTRFNADRGAYL